MGDRAQYLSRIVGINWRNIMTVKPYEFSVSEARSFNHPIFEGVTKHTFLVQAKLLPGGLPTGANARDPVGMNRRVYRDVKESLRTNEALPGSFDLMNLGITVIADKVEMVDKKTFRVLIDDEDGMVSEDEEVGVPILRALSKSASRMMVFRMSSTSKFASLPVLLMLLALSKQI